MDYCKGLHCEDGRIFKEMKFPGYNNFSGKDGHTVVGVEINPSMMSITIQHLLGNMPNVEALFKALLADQDVRDLIQRYQEKGRQVLYGIWCKDSMSGRQEWFLELETVKGSFSVTKTRKLLAVSCYGKLTEEKDANMSQGMYIGDFVELAVKMGYTEIMDVQALRNSSKVEYIFPRLAVGSLFTKKVTNLI